MCIPFLCISPWLFLSRILLLSPPPFFVVDFLSVRQLIGAKFLSRQQVGDLFVFFSANDRSQKGPKKMFRPLPPPQKKKKKQASHFATFWLGNISATKNGDHFFRGWKLDHLLMARKNHGVCFPCTFQKDSTLLQGYLEPRISWRHWNKPLPRICWGFFQIVGGSFIQLSRFMSSWVGSCPRRSVLNHFVERLAIYRNQ